MNHYTKGKWVLRNYMNHLSKPGDSSVIVWLQDLLPRAARSRSRGVALTSAITCSARLKPPWQLSSAQSCPAFAAAADWKADQNVCYTFGHKSSVTFAKENVATSWNFAAFKHGPPSLFLKRAARVGSNQTTGSRTGWNCCCQFWEAALCDATCLTPSQTGHRRQFWLEAVDRGLNTPLVWWGWVTIQVWSPISPRGQIKLLWTGFENRKPSGNTETELELTSAGTSSIPDSWTPGRPAPIPLMIQTLCNCYKW